MAGLLDFLDSPDAQLGLGLLAAGGPSMTPMSFGQRLAGAMQGVQAQRAAAEERALKKQLIEAQIGNYGSEAEYRRAQAEAQRQEAALRQAALVREAEKRAALPSLFQSPTQQALAGGGGPTQANAVVMDRLPQGQLGPIDIPTALGKGYTPKEIEELQALRNSGRPKVVRTVETTDAQGRPVILQLDEFGRPVGQGMAQWKQPVTMSLGNRQAMVDPVSRQELGSFAMGQSPDSIASNAISIRGQNMVDARARDANATAAQGRIAEATTGMRKEFDGLPEVKNYKQAYPAYAAIVDAAQRNTPQSDINLIYGIAKLYDPTSVVREGEYNTIAKNASIPDRIKGYAAGLVGGARLPETVRAQLLEEARGRISTFESEYGKAQGAFAAIAKRNGLDPSNIFTPVGQIGSAPSASSNKTVVARGKYGGRDVVKYSDGSVDYAN